jgi:hypothetical protein
MRFAGIGFSVAIVAAFVVGGIALVPRPASAGSVSDISGAWDVEYALSCNASLAQDGSSLSGTVDCGADIVVDVEGSIDSVYRTFSLTGIFVAYEVTVSGTVSADGSSLEGTWSAPPIVSEGPFSGSRLGGSPSPTDISGSWGIIVEDIFSGACAVEIDQAVSQITASIDCESGPAGTFEGTYDGEMHEFAISGPFGQFTTLEMEGTVSEDTASFSGTWFITPAGPGGVLSGERVGGPPDGDEETPTRARSEGETPTPEGPITLPPTGNGPGPAGTIAWAYGAMVAALALSAVSLLALRRAR